MARTKVIKGTVAAAIVAGAALSPIAIGTASAQPPKCELATVVSKVCPNPGRAGQFDGGETRPSPEPPGSGDWGYTYHPETNTHEWGKKDR